MRKSIFGGMAVCGKCGHSLCSCGTVYKGEPVRQDLNSLLALSDQEIEELAQSYTHLEQLNRDTLLTFVERIEIGSKIYENGGYKIPARANQPYRQSAQIFHKFIGELTENREKCSAENPLEMEEIHQGSLWTRPHTARCRK